MVHNKMSIQGEGREVAEVTSHGFRLGNGKNHGLATIRELGGETRTTIRRRTGWLEARTRGQPRPMSDI